MSLHRSLSTSQGRLAKTLRRIYHGVDSFSLPAPKIVFLPVLYVVLFCREIWFFLYRVLVCEPLFKAYCKNYGKNLHTGVYLHWIRGRGELVVGDSVTIDGKCSIAFAARYTDRPRLIIGDHTGIGHDCAFTIGKQIKIGSNCRIARGVTLFDAPGHPLDAEKRKAGLPADTADVRPLTIGDNVWIGRHAIIMPGVTIGDNSVIGVGAVVMSDVPPNVLVMGNPARKVMAL